MNSNIENSAGVKMAKETPFGKESLNAVAVVSSIIVGLAFALLVIKDFVSINVFIFALLVISAVGYTLYKDDNLKTKNFIFFASAFLIYASVFFRLEQEIYNVVCFLILPVLLVITTMYSSKKSALKGLLTFIYRALAPIVYIDKIFKGLSSFGKVTEKKSTKYKQILLGIGISVVLLFILIPLMTSAEAAFDVFIQKLIDMINIEFEIEEFFWKTVAGTAIAILFCGFLYIITKEKMTGTKIKKDTSEKEDNHPLIITVLVIIGFVFLVFAIVQFNSLFISAESLVKGSTYAECAREGYFQLVVLSIINFILVLFCTKMQRGTNRISQNAIKVLTTYFTVLNIYLLVSAAYKMNMYYDAYGLTVDRLLVYILLTFEVIALVALLVKIYKNDMPFIKVMIYYTIVFWAMVSLINIDAWVVKSNVERYEETGEIDVGYILDLSHDASSEIKEFFFENYDKLSNEEKENFYIYYFARKDMEFGYWNNELDESYSLLQYNNSHKIDNWLKFSFSNMNKYNDGLEVLEYYLEHK